MALKSPLEDFEATTLQAIPGLLAKLHYIARLHDGHGNYLHWGMGRTHGEEAARRAIRTSHAAVLTQVLRMPLRLLDEDLQRSAAGVRMTAQELLRWLIQQAPQVLLERAGAPSQKHLKAVLHALWALLESRACATRPDALPLPPPVQ